VNTDILYVIKNRRTRAIKLIKNVTTTVNINCCRLEGQSPPVPCTKAVLPPHRSHAPHYTQDLSLHTLHMSGLDEETPIKGVAGGGWGVRESRRGKGECPPSGVLIFYKRRKWK